MDHSEDAVGTLDLQEPGPSDNVHDGRMPDDELATRARGGDQHAWELLVRRYQEPAFRLAFLLLGDPDEAEDVAQDAFIRAYLHLDSYDWTRPLRPWFLSIVANLARNRQRAAGRYLAALRRLFAITPPSLHGPYSSDSQQQGQAQQLREAVRRLNQTGREIITCRYFLALSEAETAEVLGIAPGTVKSRSHRALKQLRTIIEKEFRNLQADWLE
jgi:RNA polymerase sigma factor (sigma-70 family)